MDLKRFDEISGREAANRLIDGLDVYSRIGNKYYVEDKRVWMESGSNAGVVSLTVSDTLRSTWYVKKPFDVRAEMLARPNEWVGAYQDNKMWWKVALRLDRMEAVITSYKSTRAPLETHVSEYIPFFDRCIPIEDVPEEELT